MQDRFCITTFLSQWGRVSKCVRTLCWLIGLLLGFYAAKCAGGAIVSAVSGIVLAPVSIFRSATNCVLPFLVVFLSIRMDQKWLAFTVCGLKAFSFAYCMTGIYAAFGSAGWLVCAALLFADFLTVPGLLFYWIFRSDSDKVSRLLFYALFAVLTVLTDYFCIAPILRGALL